MVAHVILVLVEQFIVCVSHHTQAHFVQIEHNIVLYLHVKMVKHNEVDHNEDYTD